MTYATCSGRMSGHGSAAPSSGAASVNRSLAPSCQGSGSALHEIAAGEDEVSPAVVEHVGDAGRGVVRIDRDIDRAGLQDGEHRDDGVDVPLQEVRHPRARRRAAAQEALREPRGVRVQLGVAQAARRAADRRLVGSLADLLREAGGQVRQ